MHNKSAIGGVILIVIGSLFLLHNFGLFSFAFLRDLWPVILIVVGLGLLLKKRA